MAGIDEYLQKIQTAVYGEEVRSSIHDAIQKCYDDAGGDYYQHIYPTPLPSGSDLNSVNESSVYLLSNPGNYFNSPIEGTTVGYLITYKVTSAWLFQICIPLHVYKTTTSNEKTNTAMYIRTKARGDDLWDSWVEILPENRKNNIETRSISNYMPESKDLNEFTNTGVYFIGSPNDYKNRPNNVSSSGLFICIKVSEPIIYQIYICYNLLETNQKLNETDYILIRNRDNNYSWSKWIGVTQTSSRARRLLDFNFVKDKTIDLDEITIPGNYIITNNMETIETILHAPENFRPVILRVEKNSDYSNIAFCVQTVEGISVSNNKVNFKFQRLHNATTWGPWINTTLSLGVTVPYIHSNFTDVGNTHPLSKIMDWNNLKESGFFLALSSVQYIHYPGSNGDTPGTISGGFVLVIRYSSEWIFQMYIEITNTNDTESTFNMDLKNGIWYRFISDTGSYSNHGWYRIGNVNKPLAVPDYALSENKTSVTLSKIYKPGNYVISNSYNVLDMPSDFKPTGLKVEKYHPDINGKSFTRQTIFDVTGASGKQFVRSSNAKGVYQKWHEVGSGSGETTVNNNFYTSEYTVTATPKITSDSNNYLAATNASDDRTADIMSMLSETQVCNLGPGRFVVDGIKIPNGGYIKGCGARTILVLKSDSKTKHCIEIDTFATIKDISFIGGSSTPTHIGEDEPSDYGEDCAIYIRGNADLSEEKSSTKRTSMISGCIFENFNGSAFYAHNSGGGLDNCVIMSDCRIISCMVGINIDYYAEYCKFSNIITWKCNIACINNGGNNIFTGCTFHGVKGVLTEANKRNPLHGSMIGCTFNHIRNFVDNTHLGMGKAIIIKDSVAGFIFDGCQLWYSTVDISNAKSIVFSNCLFGGYYPEISVVGEYGAVFNNCSFNGNYPKISNVNSKTKFINCYNFADEDIIEVKNPNT